MGTIYFITSSSEAHAMHGHKEHKLILHLIYCVGILRQNKRRETREVLGAGDCFDFDFRRLQEHQYQVDFTDTVEIDVLFLEKNKRKTLDDNKHSFFCGFKSSQGRKKVTKKERKIEEE